MTTHKPHPVPRAEFARRAGKGRSTITEASRKGGPLFQACLPRGRLDAAHPASVRWARDRKIDPAALLLASRRAEEPKEDEAPVAPGGAASSAGAVEEREPVLRFLDQTLREITDRFGSEPGFSDWLDDRKTIAETERLEIANATTRGELIRRDLVAKSVFGMINRTFLLLLRDAPRTIASRLAAMVRTGQTHEELERAAHDIVSTHLQNLKARAARALRVQASQSDEAADPAPAEVAPGKPSARRLKRKKP